MNKRTGTTAYFRCKGYETKNCKARMVVKDKVATEKGLHACGVVHQPVADDASQAQASDLSKYPDDIYHLILREGNDKFQLRAIKIPTKREVYSIIGYARGLFAPVDNFEGMIKPPFAQTQDGRVFF
ncbi:hypothetical protein HZS_1243 [Henneguya salminicola]|nr:hypothetical protein HZS_1243 [Henneguya salminicola]